jgi:hypothetical protein
LSLSWRGELSLKASATAEDTVGNFASAAYDKPLELSRISCAKLVAGNDVKAPLVFVNGRLIFAAGTELYVFDTAACSTVGTLLTGTVRGPMVALGDGSLAMATTGRGGPTKRWTPRLLMVNTAAPQPVFMQSPEEDCALGTVETDTSALFDQGRSLINFNPVRSASAANTATDSVLAAYTPSGATTAERCIGSTTIDKPFVLTPAQVDNTDLLVAYGSMYGNTIKTMKFNAMSSQWENSNWTAESVSAGILSGSALDSDGSIWVSSDSHSAEASLQSWRAWDKDPIHPYFGMAAYNFFPAVINNQGKAYVVAYHMTPSKYQLHSIGVDDNNSLSVVIPSGNATSMVGSPLLGNPRSGDNTDTELYVVTNNGRVFGYRAFNLRQLWMVELGFGISSTAQPVLVPHADGGGTLWVVGTEGQVRGIRVNSNGLHRNSPWPKAFRDNCNTSSRRVTPALMPSCF